MAPNVEISIPTASTSHTSPPYTIYNITLRLPLRSFTISKRYSDFVAFNSTLIAQTNSPPPAPLPGKHWFSNTVSNTNLCEERRQGLETYLCAINEAEDARWRSTSAWRAFLNLPSSASTQTTSAKLHAAITEPGAPGSQSAITDPTLWLDCYRDMKSHLHDARLHLTRRDQETTPQKQHESSARAKSSLVRAGHLIGALEDGLKNLGEASDGGKRGGWGAGNTLGEGEIRRRKDLLVNARKEKDGLEDLLNAIATKSRIDNAVASIQDKEALVGSASRKPARSGRVLGKETERTRELDNQGVVQLQKQTMESQDMSIEELRKIVHRQKELGIAINAELEIQNELLKLTDEDADRLQKKVDIGKKRIGKIS
ncbi:Qc-SNARE protein [Aspergillus clavatus NRRL 1]|uniref:SNARE complex subunit (Vam7), putative n=1 Tax=Aspergillus clavatus (strain ATCC 1007 / CBS 513.65 / DSM 816 / NCTC 3887 / NRRL 1 / QM 1276 / 107) TaxID=344612 RepID=A1CF71_ASPCL|nr:SNARE complex subunit (Vam7), putative [Aspergillus clavatus NRRL 1]EAW11520.1 SNARE complex subunit (Vam7), putative [Aspergillus clavatus NRRL 1]